MNETLEGMAQALFKSWFVDFDPVIDNALAAGNPIPEPLAQRAETRRQAIANGTANRETAQAFPASFRFTEELGWIPEGWKVKAVSDALQINPSLKLSKGTIAPFADMKALPTSGYAVDGIIEKAFSGGAKFQNGDVLLARITPCLENGKTGIVDFLPDESAVGFGSTEFIVMRGKGELETAFIACFARDRNFRKHCEQSMVGSSGRQRVQNSCFESYYLSLPENPAVIQSFNRATKPAFQKTSKQFNQSQTLAKLRDVLLPKLISGELRIPQAEKMVEQAVA
jgi:type I restriction enzyme S subunit